MKIKIKCEFCGKEKEIPMSYYKRRKHHFCSKECFINSGNLYEIPQTRPKTFFEKQCQNCGKTYSTPIRKSLFCCRECFDMKQRKDIILINKNKYYEIIIKKSKTNEILKCKIDKEDYIRIKNFNIITNWSKSTKSFYAVLQTRGAACKRKRILLHRFLTNCPNNLEVDHINHDTLDNRKENLKICTHKENMQNLRNRNKFGVSGVIYKKNHYESFISVNGKSIYLGYFKTMEEAIKARLNAEKIYKEQRL